MAGDHSRVQQVEYTKIDNVVEACVVSVSLFSCYHPVTDTLSRGKRERESSNSKTLFSKDCSLGSLRPVSKLVLTKLLIK